MKKIVRKLRTFVCLLGTIVCLWHTSALADQVEILGGSLTQHIINPDGASSEFAHKVSSDGTLIANPLGAYRLIKTEEDGWYESRGYFAGENSIGEAMGGAMASQGFEYSHMRLGVVVGGYMQDEQKFHDRGLQPFAMELGRVGVVPILGLEFQINLPIASKTYLTIYNVITPVLTNTTIGVGWSL